MMLYGLFAIDYNPGLPWKGPEAVALQDIGGQRTAMELQGERRTIVTTHACSGLTRVILDNGRIRATVLPELGGKMSSLIRAATGREFLLQPASLLL